MLLPQHQHPATLRKIQLAESGLGLLQSGILLFEAEISEPSIHTLTFALEHPRNRRGQTEATTGELRHAELDPIGEGRPRHTEHFHHVLCADDITESSLAGLHDGSVCVSMSLWYPQMLM